jgi:UDP-glucose 4-epimerase
MSTVPVAIVTGGAGFIGSHMVDLLLQEGYAVRVIDNLSGGRRENLQQHASNPRLHVEIGDLRDCQPDDPLFDGARYVFHFAGIGDIVPSINQPIEYLSTNVMGTVRALEAARRAGVEKFVYAASSSCYGLATELPTTEAAPVSPQYPYALSKWLGEQALLHWGQVYRLPVVSIRIFNAYGPRSRTTGAYGAVFGVFLAQKLNHKPFTVVGDGTQTRDFVFATDLVRAFWLAAQSPATQTVYNVGAGQPQSVNRLVELLGGEVVHVPKRPGEPDCTWADIAKIQRELGWQPRVSFQEGVAEMLRHIEYWRQAPVWDPASIQEATKEWFAALAASPRTRHSAAASMAAASEPARG